MLRYKLDIITSLQGDEYTKVGEPGAVQLLCRFNTQG